MDKIKNYLPEEIISQFNRFEYLNEIRLKRNSRVCVKKDGKNFILDVCTSDRVFEEILDKLFSHSYHSQLKNIVEGYISLGDGYRAGVAGNAVVYDGEITNLSEIISVNLRIPHLVRGIAEPVLDLISNDGFKSGVLIYSPPAVGKTTLLRDIILRLSDIPYNKRIALIDSRREIYLPKMERISLLDAYIGYPMAKAIELAVRTMSPDYIICDELSNENDVQAVLKNQSSGVPIIATAHGLSLSSMLSRASIASLHENHVFDYYVGLKRKSGERSFMFDIQIASEVNKKVV